MKKKSVYFGIVLLCVLFLGMTNVYATSGRLRKNSIKTCNGITYGQHSSDNHWHVAVRNSDGSYNASGDPIYSDPCASSSNSSSSSGNTSGSSNTNSSSSNTSSGSSKPASTPVATPVSIPTPTPELSSDTSLKSVTVDGNSIEVSDWMEYQTTNERVDIVVETTDSNATYTVHNRDLLEGENPIEIEVTAPNGDIKSYTLTVVREELSDNTNIHVIIDGKEITFDSMGNAEVTVSSTTDQIEYTYTLEDENAAVETEEIETLQTGDNLMKFLVTAQDGTQETYEITIHKYSFAEEAIITILSFAILGGIGYGIYYFVKKRKKK